MYINKNCMNRIFCKNIRIRGFHKIATIPKRKIFFRFKRNWKLDFIAQEMNREANTILSKASDLAISDTGINLKTDIEKVREQIQNIE